MSQEIVSQARCECLFATYVAMEKHVMFSWFRI